MLAASKTQVANILVSPIRCAADWPLDRLADLLTYFIHATEASPYDSAKGGCMAEQRRQVQQILETLKRQRVRQGDFRPVLDCLISQAVLLKQVSSTDAVAELALYMKARAHELLRIQSSVPKFVVEDLLDESIARLEHVERPSASSRS